MPEGVLSGPEKQACFNDIIQELDPLFTAEYFRKIGISQKDYDDSLSSRSTPHNRVYNLLDLWVKRTGRFTSSGRRFLKSVLREVDGKRNHEADDFIHPHEKFRSNRNIAWLLYTVADYYCQPAVWAPMVRQKFKLSDAQINRIESDFEGSSERQYRVLLSWIKRLGLVEAEAIRLQLQQLKITIPDTEYEDNEPHNVPQSQDDILPEEQVVNDSTWNWN